MASSSTSSSARSSEFQKQIKEVQSRLTDFIEATRPAHEANLRRAAALRTRTEPQEKVEQGNDQPQASRPSRNTPKPVSPDSFSPEPGSPLGRHARKCKICSHPDREAFEADFLDWCQASWLQHTYHIRDESTIYRHARATGLLQRRRENVRMVAEKILEHVDAIDTPSAFAILRAVRTLACLNERGQWTEPPTTHVVVNSPEPSSLQHQTSSLQNSNRQSYEKLELDVTDTKHSPEVISNRQSM